MKKSLFLIAALSFSLVSAMELMGPQCQSAHNPLGGTIPKLQELAAQNLVQTLIRNVDNTNLGDPQDIIDTLQTGRNLEEGIDNPGLKQDITQALLKHFSSVKAMLTQFKLTETIPWSKDEIRSIQFNPRDDTQLIIRSWLGDLVHIITRNPLRVIEIPGNHNVMAYTADGQYIAASRGSTIDLYDTNGKLERTLECSDHIAALAPNPKDNTLIVGTNLGYITVWDPLTGGMKKYFPTYGTPCNISCNSAGTKMVAWKGNSLIFKNLDTSSLNTRRLSDVEHLAYAPNGNLAVSTHIKSQPQSHIRLLHSGTYEDLKLYTTKTRVTGLAYNPDPDTNQLAVSYRKRTYIIDPDVHETLEEGQVIVGNSFNPKNAYNTKGTLLAITGPYSIKIYRNTETIPLDKMSISSILFLALTNCLQKDQSTVLFDTINHAEIATTVKELLVHEGLRGIIAKKWIHVSVTKK